MIRTTPTRTAALILLLGLTSPASAQGIQPEQRSPKPELSPSAGSSDRSSPSPGTTPAPTPGTPGATGPKANETPAAQPPAERSDDKPVTPQKP
jgi:hypothetical protein